MNRKEVALLLAVVQSGDRRTVGETDVELWWQVAKDVPFEFAREAVLAHFRDQPGVWLEPGHVYSRWRDYRRDQIAREDDAMRDARQAVLDARLVGLEELAEAKAIPGPEKFTRPSSGGQPAALSVPCPWCKATVGQSCRVPDTRMTLTKTQAHPKRVELAEKQHQEVTA